MEITLIILVSLVCSFFAYKYFTLRNKVKKILDDYHKPLRKGFYREDCASVRAITGEETKYVAISHVTEIERYKNGTSKIKLEHVDIVCAGTINNEQSRQWIKANFCSIIETNKVEWLEVEDDIKELRRLKLEKIKASI